MARRRLEKRSIRKLTRTGGGRSISVTLPIDVVRSLKWRNKQKVVVTRRGKGILIVDWPVRHSRSVGGKPKKRR